jgi:hypothetical protein
MPKVNDDVPSQVSNQEQALTLLREKKGPDGKLLYFSDPKHRAQVDALRVQIQNTKGAA